MRRTLHTTILFFMLFFVGNISANTITDSSNITIQVVVSESMAIKHCNYGYASSALNISHQKNNACKFNRESLLKEANQLASRHNSYKNKMNIVTLTVTAP